MNQTNEAKHRFQDVIRRLNKYPWFKKEKWLTSVHISNVENSMGVVIFQVFKKTWSNQEHQGVRFESYLDLTDKKQKKSSVALQLFNQEKKSALDGAHMGTIRPLTDAVSLEVHKLNDYRMSEVKYSSQPFIKYINLSENFEEELTQELAHLCQNLGKIIDQVIERN